MTQQPWPRDDRLNMKTIPSQETLKALLNYNPETGAFEWLPRPRDMFTSLNRFHWWNKRYAGKPALCYLGAHGYQVGRILVRQYRAHRVAWKWMTGDDPSFIDHINGDRLDNRWANLRCVDARGNARNRAMPKNNQSGRIGVSWVRRQQQWSAQIQHGGKRMNLGLYDNFADAVAVRSQAETDMGYHVNHGRAS